MPPDQQRPHRGRNLVLARGAVPPPGLVAQLPHVVTDIGEHLRTTEVAAPRDQRAGTGGGRPIRHRQAAHARAVQAVRWNSTVGMAPLGHRMPEEPAVVPVVDVAPSRVGRRGTR
ncbi:hypothetical protein [Streptomyces sp. NPDC048581]|uniref:hypothetical protein n=1 Tax=unclassified Streptomyces TaxID=2593676 RepID=UPI00371511A1